MEMGMRASSAHTSGYIQNIFQSVLYDIVEICYDSGDKRTPGRAEKKLFTENIA